MAVFAARFSPSSFPLLGSPLSYSRGVFAVAVATRWSFLFPSSDETDESDDARSRAHEFVSLSLAPHSPQSRRVSGGEFPCRYSPSVSRRLAPFLLRSRSYLESQDR